MGDDFTRRVAAEVRAEMARQQMSQEKLARLCGITQSTLSRRITAEYPFDTAELARVAAALGVTVAHLMPSERGDTPASVAS